MTLYSRRAFGRAGAATLALATTAGATRPADRGRAPTFVLVHGAFGRAAHMADLANGLAVRGHRALAVELPGHERGRVPYSSAFQAPQDLEAWATVPSPLAGIELRHYVEHTVNAVRQVAAYGPVVLVGASAGGLVISLVANTVPQLVSHLVYDDAYCCVALPSVAAYSRTPEAAGAHTEFLGRVVVGDPTKLGVLRVNWRSADPEYLAGARLAFMTEDAPDTELFELLNNLHPDDPLSVNEADARVEGRTWGRVPRTFIRHTRDGLVPLALQDRMIREADELTPSNRFAVHSVATGHAPGVDRAGEIVDIVAGVA